MSDGILAWDVTIPEVQRSSMGARPRGTLSLITSDRGEESFTLPLAVARSLKASHDADELHPESRAELLWIVKDRSLRCAALRMERLVDKRDYSSQELSNKLRQDGYSEQVREEVVARAVDSGIVDDARYADIFVRTKISSGWGINRIEAELNRRGVDATLLEGWPEAYFSDTSEEERALELARTRRIAEKNGYEKLVRFLCGRGYTLAVSYRVARQVIDERTID